MRVRELNCCEKVSGQGGWHMFQCEQKGTVEVDGKLYCWQHDPAKVAAKRKAKEDKRAAERARGEVNTTDGDALIKRLGCGGIQYRDGRVVRRITITFSEAEAIAKRLRR